ncbi:MAG TPA: hypothetical protein VGG75_33210 [Trebonia sp.]
MDRNHWAVTVLSRGTDPFGVGPQCFPGGHPGPCTPMACPIEPSTHQTARLVAPEARAAYVWVCGVMAKVPA